VGGREDELVNGSKNNLSYTGKINEFTSFLTFMDKQENINKITDRLKTYL
jgi:hypothetical protein